MESLGKPERGPLERLIRVRGKRAVRGPSYDDVMNIYNNLATTRRGRADGSPSPGFAVRRRRAEAPRSHIPTIHGTPIIRTMSATRLLTPGAALSFRSRRSSPSSAPARGARPKRRKPRRTPRCRRRRRPPASRSASSFPRKRAIGRRARSTRSRRRSSIGCDRNGRRPARIPTDSSATCDSRPGRRTSARSGSWSSTGARSIRRCSPTIRSDRSGRSSTSKSFRAC